MPIRRFAILGVFGFLGLASACQTSEATTLQSIDVGQEVSAELPDITIGESIDPDAACVLSDTCGDGARPDTIEVAEAVESPDDVSGPPPETEADLPAELPLHETVDVAEHVQPPEPDSVEETAGEPAPEAVETDLAGPDESGEVAGTWFDPATGSRWQEPPTEQKMNASAAATYCSDLALGGFTDWRLPTVGELRSLIRGCDQTVVGGSCGVDDTCFQSTCGGLFDCLGCDANLGPAQGCYWPAELTGVCGWYWSGTKVAGAIGGTFAWCALFEDGSLRQGIEILGSNNVRCVR